MNSPTFIFCSWKSSRTMTLVDALEYTAVASPVFQLDNQIFLDRAQWRHIVRNVKNFTIRDPSTKAVSFLIYYFVKLFWYDISIIPLTCAEWREASVMLFFCHLYFNYPFELLKYIYHSYFLLLACQRPSITLNIYPHYYVPSFLLFWQTLLL